MKTLRLFELLIFILLFLFLFYPVALLLLGAFVQDGVFSLHLFSLLRSDPYKIRSLFNSLNLAAMVSIATLAIGIPLSFVFTKYDFVGKKISSYILLLPLIIPPFVGALGVRQLLGRFGSLNLILLDLGVISNSIDFLQPGSFFGVFLLQTVHLFPLVFLSLSAALSSLNYSLVEVAQSLGATPFKIFLKIVFPLLFPTALGALFLTFVASLADLGTPLLFEYRQVLSVQIFQLLTEAQDTPLSLALCVCLTAICGLLFCCSRFLTSEHTSSVSKSFTPIPICRLEGFYLAIFYLLFFILVLISLLPHIGVVTVSFSEQWFLTPLPSAWTIKHYVELLYHPLTQSSFFISLLLSIVTVIIASILALLISYLRERSPSKISIAIDTLLILPLALPGILFAFGYLKLFSLTILDPRNNPLPLLLLAYITRRIPLIVNTTRGALRSLPRSLEECAWCAGATRIKTLRLIVLPQVRGSVLAGAALTGIASMLEVSESMFLALDERYYPVSKALYALSGRPDGVPIACALSTLLIISVLLFLIIVSRIAGKSLTTIMNGAKETT
jgi:iron(III) transport system permease protein